MPRKRKTVYSTPYKAKSNTPPMPMPGPPPTNRESPLRAFSQNLMAGMALGTGSSLAHHGINTMMGSSPSNVSSQPQVMPTNYKYPSREELDLKKCILENNGDTWACQEYYEKFCSHILKNS